MRKEYKDILIGYIATLTDRECQEIYYGLNEKGFHKCDWVCFDKVRITRSQYSKLMYWWGEDKLKECIDILNEWLSRTELKFKFASHYKMLLGWVDVEYRKTHKKDRTLQFNSTKIDTAWKARKYVRSVPEDLRAYDSEVRILVERFGSKILD